MKAASFALIMLVLIEAALFVTANGTKQQTPESAINANSMQWIQDAQMSAPAAEIKSDLPCRLQSSVTEGPIRIESIDKNELDQYLIKTRHGLVKANYAPLGALKEDNQRSCHLFWVTLNEDVRKGLPLFALARVKKSSNFQTDVTLDFSADIYRSPERLLQNIPQPMAADIFKRVGQCPPTSGSLNEMAAWLGRNQVEGNVPDENEFDLLLTQSLDDFFTAMEHKPTLVHFDLLRKIPSQVGVAWPKYYAWIRATDRKSGRLVHIGAVSVSAINKEGFDVNYFYSAGQIAKEPRSIDERFTQNLRPVIIEKAKNCTGEEKSLR
jgi:hypothetical protein